VVVDAFLLVCLFVSFSLFLISARRVLYLISPVCFCPLIRVPKRGLWSPGAGCKKSNARRDWKKHSQGQL